MMVRHIRLDRRQFYLFEGLGINSHLLVRMLFNASSGFSPESAIQIRPHGLRGSLGAASCDDAQPAIQRQDSLTARFGNGADVARDHPAAVHCVD
jgi:hypothetical protein